ncbi:hypothetical protein AHAS_Ahas14G0165800 [Arachis hypogaea]
MERYQEMLRKYLHHAFPEWLQLHTFYDGVSQASRILIDSSAGGSLYQKTLEKALELTETVANNHYMYDSERTMKKGVMGLDTLDALRA